MTSDLKLVMFLLLVPLLLYLREFSRQFGFVS